MGDTVGNTVGNTVGVAVGGTTGVVAVGAVSWRGRNPAALKLNQDAVMIAEHAATASLLVGVFDGHGVNGREVSAWFKERYPRALFTDARFLAAGARGGGAGGGGAGVLDRLVATLRTEREGVAEGVGSGEVMDTRVSKGAVRSTWPPYERKHSGVEP